MPKTYNVAIDIDVGVIAKKLWWWYWRWFWFQKKPVLILAGNSYISLESGINASKQAWTVFSTFSIAKMTWFWGGGVGVGLKDE